MNGVDIQISAARMDRNPSGASTSHAVLCSVPVSAVSTLLTSPTFWLKNHLN